MASNMQMRDPYRAKKMRVYFRFSMIAVACVVVVAIAAVLMGGKNEPIDYSKSDFVQYEAPEDSAPVVVFETTEGSFKAVLYENEAPEYCKFFEGLVNDGYFDDTYVCTLLRTEGITGGFIAGSKTEDGMAADDTNTDMIDIEVSANLLPTTGSLGSLVREGGRFSKPKAGSVFTVLSDVVDVNELRNSSSGDVNGFLRVCDIFEKYGGVPNYLQMYTLFGQVYDGWDTLEKIFGTKIVDEDAPADKEDINLRPDHEIKLTKVYMSTYGENKENGYNIPLKEKNVALPESETASSSAE